MTIRHTSAGDDPHAAQSTVRQRLAEACGQISHAGTAAEREQLLRAAAAELGRPCDDDDSPPEPDRPSRRELAEALVAAAAAPGDGRIAKSRARSIVQSSLDAAARASEPAWYALLHRGPRGEISGSAANIATILRKDHNWIGVLEYDVRTTACRFVREPLIPQALVAPSRQYPSDVTDTDLGRIAGYLERFHGVRAAKDAVSLAVTMAAEASPRDAVKEYLEALEWDGINRIDTWLSEYLGTENSAYARGIACRWLISGVARTYQPGCQVDYALVLEGEQGAGKTSALMILAGDGMYAEGQLDLRSKDALDTLRGPWIIEFAELSSLRRAEVEQVKSYISRRVDRFRPAYGERTRDFPRRTIFAATTNESEYLRDATGGRRFWPVRTGAIDLPALARDRDQLWAEAVSRYRRSEPWWPDGQLVTLATGEQEERYERDEWEPLIGAYLAARSDTTIREIARYALSPRRVTTSTGEVENHAAIDDANLDRYVQRRIADILHRLHWRKSKHCMTRQMDGQKYRTRVYHRPASSGDA